MLKKVSVNGLSSTRLLISAFEPSSSPAIPSKTLRSSRALHGGGGGGGGSAMQQPAQSQPSCANALHDGCEKALAM
eukprot:2095817-Prymnesium_polylepis.1